MDSNSCDICYERIKDKVTLECKHELCPPCFLEVMGNLTTSSHFKCHMCRKKYNWVYKTKEDEHILEETLSILIREDDENQFLSLVGSGMSKAFEIIVNNLNLIQFIVILETRIDTEELKLLISELVVGACGVNVFGILVFQDFSTVKSAPYRPRPTPVNICAISEKHTLNS